MKVAMGIREARQIHSMDYLQFLRQIGVTHALGFMYDVDVLPSAAEGYWSEDDLKRLVRHFKEHGLEFEAIENFVPRHWYKILMDLPGQEIQLENIKRTISNMGKAGISIMGYNFSAGAVHGLYRHPVGRGGAVSVSFNPEVCPLDNTYIPRSMAWGRVVDPTAQGEYPDISREEMRQRLYRFLEQILPVCADANVRLAAHPEDPPIPYFRHAGRVLIRPGDFDRMFSQFPTPYCTAEFCQGTFTEMGMDIYSTIRHFASQNRISYVHLRNVRGKIPNYDETLIDDGDVNMAQALLCYHECGFDGALIPDHFPGLSGDTEGLASVAYAIGQMRGIMKALNIPIWGD